MRIEWNNSYSVGIKVIDDQHKTLFDTVNRLSEAIIAKKGKDVLGDVLAELKAYTLVHFETEEKMMDEWSFSGYANHKAKHAELIAKVDDLQDRFGSNAKVLNTEVLGILVLWLKEHVGVTDKGYSPFFKAMGVM